MGSCNTFIFHEGCWFLLGTSFPFHSPRRIQVFAWILNMCMYIYMVTVYVCKNIYIYILYIHILSTNYNICKICMHICTDIIAHSKFKRFNLLEKHDFPLASEYFEITLMGWWKEVAATSRDGTNLWCLLLKETWCFATKVYKGHVQPCFFVVETIEIKGSETHRNMFQKNVTSLISSIQIHNYNHISFIMFQSYSSNSL